MNCLEDAQDKDILSQLTPTYFSLQQHLYCSDNNIFIYLHKKTDINYTTYLFSYLLFQLFKKISKQK